MFSLSGSTSKLRAFATRLAVALALLLPLLMATESFAAERRIALVIGNGNYKEIANLKNPVNDARLMRTTLQKLGFEVIYREDANKAEMDSAVSAFGEKLTAAGTQGVALFYYAGHGVQSGGENFLLPTNSSVSREADLRLNAVRAVDILAQMEGAQSGVKIVILDACRNNPFGARFRVAQDGLAGISLGNTEFTVAYAATEGKLAEDGGSSVNSPYALALARRLTTPGSGIGDIFRLVRIDVSKATAGRQLPEARTTMMREFYFNPVVGEKTQMASAIPAVNLPPVAADKASPSQLMGKWCQTSRSAGFSMKISSRSMDFSANGSTTSFPIRSITSNSMGNLEVKWLNNSVPTILEFGDFSNDGKSMTQLRGRAEQELNWRSYGKRFDRC